MEHLRHLIRKQWPWIATVILLSANGGYFLPGAHAAGSAKVQSLEVTILSTMLADRGIGEWGFAALVVVDGHRILFDTGGRPDTVLDNARALGIDLAGIRDVILSHNHWDHTGGLIRLRETYLDSDPDTLSRAHVGQGIFWPRPGQATVSMTERRARYEALGGEVIEYDGPAEILPGVWLTGPVPRVHGEKNYGNPLRDGHPVGEVHSPDGVVDDNIPESMSLVIDTEKGLVVISGCGHAGMINTLDYARKIAAPESGAPEALHAAIGGFHLLFASDEQLAWTADRLKGFGLQQFVGAHCTGIEPVYRFRELLDLPRSASVVGAVGAGFSLEAGINPLVLAR
jgi:7,8-dihydropterin-6-yl-methyl-4-(beta-D-ribofuranosyl)aminobenzene 5'-phosphate synthase